MVSALVVMAAAALMQQPACGALKNLTLPAVTITAADLYRGGVIPSS